MNENQSCEIKSKLKNKLHFFPIIKYNWYYNI